MTLAPPDGSPERPDPAVAVLVYPELLELELGAALTALGLAGEAEYAGTAGVCATVARSRASVVGAGGLVSTPQVMFAALPPPRAVFVPGGPGALRAARDPLVLAFLKAETARGSLFAASGSGVLVLGEAGVLRDRRVAVTPGLEDGAWGHDPAEVQTGGWAQDGPVITARGGLGALDAALALGAALFGVDKALEVARRLGHGWAPQQEAE